MTNHSLLIVIVALDIIYCCHNRVIADYWHCPWIISCPRQASLCVVFIMSIKSALVSVLYQLSEHANLNIGMSEKCIIFINNIRFLWDTRKLAINNP